MNGLVIPHVRICAGGEGLTFVPTATIDSENGILHWIRKRCGRFLPQLARNAPPSNAAPSGTFRYLQINVGVFLPVKGAYFDRCAGVSPPYDVAAGLLNDPSLVQRRWVLLDHKLSCDR